MVKTFLSFLMLLSVANSCSQDTKKNTATEDSNQSSKVITNFNSSPKLDFEKTKKKAQEALAFCKQKNLNTQFCILIDMELHSGLNRFLVWDFQKDTVKYSFPVSHGCCSLSWGDDQSKENPTFSNEEGSHCSSKGKYKLGERGYSDWGINVKYLMHGLETSNKNALSRYIVFHAWDLVSDEATYPSGTPEGWGCPAISNNNFKLIDPLLQKAGKSVLMWIYED